MAAHGLSRGERLAIALRGAEIEAPDMPLPECLFLALEKWNKSLEERDIPCVENTASLAQMLTIFLDHEGWCISDLASGECRMFVSSGLERAIEAYSTEVTP